MEKNSTDEKVTEQKNQMNEDVVTKHVAYGFCSYLGSGLIAILIDQIIVNYPDFRAERKIVDGGVIETLTNKLNEPLAILYVFAVGLFLYGTSEFFRVFLQLNSEKKQKSILIITAIMILLMIVYPPYIVSLKGVIIKAGYCFIFDMVKYEGIYSTINTPQLLVQFLGVVIVSGLFLVAFKDKK